MFAMCGSSVQILPVRLQTVCLWPNTQGLDPMNYWQLLTWFGCDSQREERPLMARQEVSIDAAIVSVIPELREFI